VYLIAKFDRPKFSRSEVILRTNKQTNKHTHKQTPLKTSTSFRYTTPVGKHIAVNTRYISLGMALTLTLTHADEEKRRVNFQISLQPHVQTAGFLKIHTTPEPYYGPFSVATRVSRCQKRTSGLYGARED